MGFLELRRQCGVSHEVGQGPQGASLVAPGMSGLHSCGEGERALLLSHGRGIGPQDALKNDSRGLSRVASVNPGFPRLVPLTQAASQGASKKSGLL